MGSGIRRVLVAISGLVAALAVAAWYLSHRPARTLIPSGACSGCNVLLITIDTLRLDRVGAFGGASGVTPTLDRLADEGLRLTHAYSSAPLTLPSHASILTAVPPAVHGVHANGLFRLRPTVPTLATILKDAGYRTGAFVGSFVLDARFGLNRGFDEYDDRYGEAHEGDPAEGAERRAEDVIKPATKWILENRETTGPNGTTNPKSLIPNPWFAWVHLYDPHEPYNAPEAYASRYAPYDAEIAYADAMVGKLLADLQAAGELDRTLVMVAADHGESLGEHGERTHGVFAYDVTTRVPWILWAGRRLQRARSDVVVRLIDLAPTVLDMLAVGSPAEFAGRSVLPAVADAEAAPRAAYIEAMDANLTRNWAPLTAIVRDGYKFIDLPIPELYDLNADPRETTNLFAQARERARTLQDLLRAATARAGGGSTGESITLGAQARERLRALGYIATAAAPGSRAYTDADDPKRLIEAAEQLNTALRAFRAGSASDAFAAVRAVIRDHPSFTTAYGELASMQRDTGDLPAAIKTLEEVVGRGAADQSVLVVLAGYLQEAGALDKAKGILDAVVAEHPDYAEAHNSLGVVSSRLGRHVEARAAFRRVLDLDPTSAKAYENLGVDELAAGDLESASADLTRALALDPDLAGVHNALAAVLLRQDRREEALAHWRTAVRLNPRLYDALYNLGTVLYSMNRPDEARPYIERFISDAPAVRYAPDIARLRAMLAK